MPVLRLLDSSVRHLELGSSTDVGRGDLLGGSDFVSRRQAVIVITESGGVEVRSLGSNPTGIRFDANAPWSWLSKGQVAAAHPPPLQLCLDKKHPSTTLLSLEPAEEAAAEPSSAPSSESAGSGVRITSTRSRDERDAEARRNAIDLEAIEDAPAPPPSAEPAGKRVKTERGHRGDASGPPAAPPQTAPLPTPLRTQRPARDRADADFELLESTGLLSFGGAGLGLGGTGLGLGGTGLGYGGRGLGLGGRGLGVPPAAARAAGTAAAAASARAASKPPARTAVPSGAADATAKAGAALASGAPLASAAHLPGISVAPLSTHAAARAAVASRAARAAAICDVRQDGLHRLLDLQLPLRAGGPLQTVPTGWLH